MRTEKCVTWVICSFCLITLSVCRPVKDVGGEAFASDNEVFRKNEIFFVNIVKFTLFFIFVTLYPLNI